MKSVMIGHAVADALGVPVEFRSREELTANPVTTMRGFGSYPVPAGTWSDDTSMALAALDSLADGTVDLDAIMGNFARWVFGNAYTATDELFDVGNTSFSAIKAYQCNHLPAVECGLSDERSNGNGSLMRIHPFVLYAYINQLSPSEKEHLIRSASSLTHAHVCSQVGCLIYAFVLEHLLVDPSKKAIESGLRAAEEALHGVPGFAPYARIFEKEFSALPTSEIRSSGYVVDTLEAALWCLLTTNDYRSCVLKAVNLGSDTDTVAAVAGGLAGALYGYDGIPTEWRKTLIRRDVIEEMCVRAGSNWKK